MYSIHEVLDISDGVEYDLVTLDDLKAALSITGSSEDSANEARITRNSKLIGEYCDRIFAAVDVRETFVFATGEASLTREPLNLWQYPIISVSSVTVGGSEITDYEFDASKGQIWRTSGTWSGRVVIEYRGGYELPGDAPASLSTLVIEAVRQSRSFSSADPTIRGTQHGDTRVDYYSAPQQGSHGLPAVVVTGLASFRRISIA